MPSIAARFPSLTAPVLALLLLVCAFPVRSEDAPAETDGGKVVLIRNGKLERFDMDAWKALAVGDAVRFKQRLKTEPAALAVLNLNKIGKFVLGPGSDLIVDKSSGEIRTDLARGAVWIDADLKPGESLSVRTALASTGVRGTMFSVMYSDQGMKVCTCQGLVSLKLRDGKTLSVNQGESVGLDASGKQVGMVQSGKDILRTSGKDPGFAYCYTCHDAKGLLKNWKRRLSP